jgi:NADH dehydrogenase [ubiquinone] 1 alpha subcomplex assembly factor 7
MTTLRSIINAHLAANGVMTLHDYMALSLYHPQHGYYHRDQVIGSDGDFITAPEISQMFGELTGLWLAHQYQHQHLDDKAALVELGPGRGTLMADLIRAWRQTSLPLPSIHLVETSPTLRAAQQERLSDIADIHWHDDVKTLPDQPLLVIANEFFDALAIRQYRLFQDQWQERVIQTDTDGHWKLDWLNLCSSDPLPVCLANLTPHHNVATDQIITHAPALAEIIGTICQHIANHGGACLIIDYGKADGFGDSLQAVMRHEAVDPLAHPGEADITAWVDISHLAQTADDHHCAAIGPIPQGQFLKSLGLLERAEQLGQGAEPDLRRRLVSEVDRLVNPAQMGQAFKVMAILPDEVAKTPQPGLE